MKSDTIFPQPLRAGDPVALVAAAGPVEPDQVEGSVRLLQGRGLTVRVRDDIAERDRYLAGPDARRAKELVDALTDPEVRAVFLARGGYGVQRILTSLERLPAIPAPKPVIGFSDNTALLGLLAHQWGWAVLHGPHPRHTHPDELDEVLGCLGYYGAPTLPRFEGLTALGAVEGDGVAEAPVVGGCLSILSSSVGTGYALQARDRLLFIEEIGEAPYRIDRMLHHLLRAGALDGVCGVVFGEPETFLPEGYGQDQLEQLEHLLEEFADELNVPVAVGLPSGHTEPNRALPLGPRARLDGRAGTLEYLEPMVK